MRDSPLIAALACLHDRLASRYGRFDRLDCDFSGKILNMRMFKLFVMALFAASPIWAKEVHPGQDQFLKTLGDETKADRATRAAWKKLLDGAEYQQSIINAISRPAEATKPWHEYRKIFLTDQRRKEGVAFWRTHHELLEKVSVETGVPAEIIVAIIGVETSYGKITGKYKVIDALTTLGLYYPPRAPFFSGELKQFLRLPDARFPADKSEVLGSYAGAMGWGQFMPTSFANWARDYDEDGKIDLWHSHADIVASVANYFVQHGWLSDQPVAERAAARADAKVPELRATETLYTVGALAELGYSLAEDLAPEMPATLLVLDGDQGKEFWVTHQNFYVISRYNRSPLYSLAVYQLSQQLAADWAREASAP